MILLSKGYLVILTALLAVSAGAWLVWAQDSSLDAEIESCLSEPNILEKLEQVLTKERLGTVKNLSPPLVLQAGLFAKHLNPPKPLTTGEPPKTAVQSLESRLASVSAPKTVTPKFKLLATSVHTDDPTQSIALIDEPGLGQRWVHVDMRVGHRWVHAIDKGSLILRNRKGDVRDEVLITRETTIQTGVEGRVAEASTDRPKTPRILPKAHAKPEEGMKFLLLGEGKKP